MPSFGVQTFTVRAAQKRDIREAYLRLIRLEIRTLEVARIDFNQKNADTLRSLVDAHGIEIVSIQVKPKYVFGDRENIVSFCKTVGCTNVVISMLPFRCILGGEAHFWRFVSLLDTTAQWYAERGITLAYHHHNWEYIKLSSGKTRMQVLLEETKKIKFVHDTYWTARCGISPEAQIREFGERLLGVHLRDLTHRRKGLSVLPVNAAVGDGVIDFAAVLRAGEAVGCTYYVIEQNTKQPYEKIEKSLGVLWALDAKIQHKE